MAMFIFRVVEAMEKLAGLATEFLSKVVGLANGEYQPHGFSDFLGTYIDRSAKELALAICQKEKVRFVVKEVFPGDTGMMYFIRSGLPGHVGDHGFGLEELLYEPKKEALVEAYESEKVVIVNDAKRDHRTSYMRSMTQDPKYDIDHIAVIPVNFDGRFQVGFLVIIDIVNSPQQGFVREQQMFLEKAHELIIRTIRDASELMHKMKISRMKEKSDLLLSLHHEIRNPLTVLGGFARRMPGVTTDETVLKYAGIMVDESVRLEKVLNDLPSFMAVEAPDDAVQATREVHLIN